jgi:D-arabinose 1-dehydrogenase-like Zn-dependent alcohol dehydrogenase
MSVFSKGLTIQGGTISSKGMHHQMLKFAEQHQIKPVIEEFSMSVVGITDAMQKLKEGKIRYRAVLVV